MLRPKLHSLSKIFRGRSKPIVALALFAATASVPILLHGTASAEVPFDGWQGKHAKWINRMTLEFNNAYFIDSDPSDRVYNFTFQALSNGNCVSRLAYNHDNAAGIDQPSPYGNAGVASEAGLDLWVPQGNGTGCDEVTFRDGACSNGTWTYYEGGGSQGWTGCRTSVDNVGARLISFFLDTDGNIKGISPGQAISFVTAPNSWNGETVYIRSDQLQAPCKNIITKIGGQWVLFSLKPGTSQNWAVYKDIVKTATGAGAPGSDSCDFNDDAFLHTYFAGLASGVRHTGEGGYIVNVGDTSNAGASKGAVSGSTTPGSVPPGGSAADITPTCESSGFSLNWILCPIFNTTAGFVEWLLTNVIQPLLRTDDFLSTDKPVYQIWSQFRIYANIFLIIAVIVIVFGQTIGTSMFEAYTVRTFLTRLLFVIILTNLSIYIMAGFLDIINVLGSGIGAAMTAPLHGAGLFKFTPTSLQQGGVALTVGAVGIGAAISGVLWGGLIGPEAAVFLGLFVLLPAVFGVLAIIFTIGARKGLLIGFAILSPVFAALYALPNTEKYSRKFVDWTVTTAMVGIILPAIFALSNIMAYLVITADQSSTHSVAGAKFTSVLNMFLGFFFTFAPLLAGGLAFKWSGGLIARGHEFLSGVGKRGHQAILGNPNDPNSTRNLARRRLGAAITQGQSDVLARGDPNNAGFFARQRARFVGSGLFGDVTQRQSNFNALAAKQRAAKSDTGDDSEIFAGGGFSVGKREVLPDGTINRGGTRYFSSKADPATGYNKEIGEVLYRRGKRLHGQNSHEVGESLMYTLGKNQNEADKRAFRVSFGKNALEQGWSEGEMVGAYAHAAYPHKRNHASVWYSSPEYTKDRSGRVTGVRFNDVGEMQNLKTPQVDPATGATMTQDHTSYNNMIEDLHKSRGSFDLSGDRHEDFQVMHKWQQQLEGRVQSGIATQSDLDALGKTYETFDAVSQRLQTMTDSEGNVSASGATPAAQGVIKDAVSQRRLALTQADATGAKTFFDPGSVRGYRSGNAVAVTSVPTGARYGNTNTAGGNAYTGAAPRENMPRTVRR